MVPSGVVKKFKGSQIKILAKIVCFKWLRIFLPDLFYWILRFLPIFFSVFKVLRLIVMSFDFLCLINTLVLPWSHNRAYFMNFNKTLKRFFSIEVFIFLPIFIVVFIAIRVILMSYWSNLITNHFFLPLRHKWAFIGICWMLLILMAVKTLKMFSPLILLNISQL